MGLHAGLLWSPDGVPFVYGGCLDRASGCWTDIVDHQVYRLGLQAYAGDESTSDCGRKAD